MTPRPDQPDPSPISVRRIDAAQTHPLRHLVLRPHQTIEQMVYDCDDLPETVHFGAFRPDDDGPIGIVTLLLNPREGASWQLRGMATHPEARGVGAGWRLVEACLAHALDPSVAPDAHTHDPSSAVWCNARTSAQRFYERCGFSVVSDEFDIPGIGPHVVMATPLTTGDQSLDGN